MTLRSICLFILLLVAQILPAQDKAKPLKVGIVGLVHTHVHGILGREKLGDIDIVGIAEPNRALAEQYARQHGYDMKLVYASMEEMISNTKPEAVLAFNTIYDHLKVVEYCAPKGIHVMVEKPLAVNMEHASKMIALAKKYKIHLLTNYETTWYGSKEEAYRIAITERKIGDLRKIVFHTGHSGPVEIGCNPEFLEWLTDPKLNGGGALTDFGCYGADIATWLMHGEIPVSVTAITQQIKPELYPKVEDEATIIIKYPKAQVIIEASWNWPYSRKDMEVYGKTGYVFCKDGTKMIYRENEKSSAIEINAPALPKNRNDPFVYFANVINGSIQMKPFDLSSPKNNEMVIRILDAARNSARTGKTVTWGH